MSYHNDSGSSVQTIRLWKISDKKLNEVTKAKLDLEERIEDWIASDISIISPSLMYLGRQIETSYGGIIDVLGMEKNGDLVIIELKKDKTPRDITAQVIDYASWVKDLTASMVQQIAEKYTKKSLEEAYTEKFHEDLPESINQEHKMLVVGSEIDPSSQRIIHYLSESYGLPINAITFNYFKDENSEYLARTFLIEQTIIPQGLGQGKRRTNLTEDQLQSIADEKEVGEIYSYLVDKLTALFDYKGTTLTTIAFVGNTDGKQKTIFSLVPQESNSQGVKFRVYLKRLAEYFKISEEMIKSHLPLNKKKWKYYKNAPPEYQGYEGFFSNQVEADGFLEILKK